MSFAYLDPTGGLLSAFSDSISVIIDLGTKVQASKSVPDEVKTCSALTNLISGDLEYLLILRSKASVVTYLSLEPDLARRIDKIIVLTRDAILDVGKLLEGCRKDIYAKGKVPLKMRLKWMNEGYKAFQLREANLQGVHRAVLGEISFLRTIDTAAQGVVVKPIVEPESFENLELLGMSDSKKHKVMVQEVEYEGTKKGGQIKIKGTAVLLHSYAFVLLNNRMLTGNRRRESNGGNSITYPRPGRIW